MESRVKLKSKIVAMLILIITLFSYVSPIFAATGTFVGRPVRFWNEDIRFIK